MKNIDFKLSKELKDIIDYSFKITKDSKCSKVSLETVAFSLVQKYAEFILHDEREKAECVFLYDVFKDLNFSDLVSLEGKLKTLSENAIKITKIPEMMLKVFSADTTIVFAKNLEQIIERADEFLKLVTPGGEYNEITTMDFLLSLLHEDDNVSKAFLKVDITPSKLLNYMIPKDTKDLKELFTGLLKSKNISMDDGFLKGLDIDLSRDDHESDEGEADDKKKDDHEEEERQFEEAGRRSDIKSKKVDPNSKTPALDQYAINITKNARENKYDPVIGRDKEINQIIEILCCRKKNNAVLLGDPGCGKTAVVENLAQRIIDEKVPNELLKKRIFSLDLNALVSGTQYRGQYEQRLQDIIKEVIENKDIIIFIDEMHNLIGNGSSSGSGDAANILKPYLARGEFQCIGSTTTDEYRKFIEKDGALKRRFSPVFVNEPTLEETVEILKGLSNTYGKFHGVKYSDAVLQSCAELAGKYINDRYFPDKAIGVLDMASSLTKLKHPADMTEVTAIEKRLAELRSDRKKAVEEDRLNDGMAISAEISEVEEKLEKAKLDLKTGKDIPEVTMDELSSVISTMSGVPVDKIKSSDINKLKSMKSELQSKVIGQDEAVEQLVLALQRNIMGLRNPNKPICSFLLVGPTGVGKSLISKVVAEEFMGSDKSLITIACSEYMQDWAESKLLGSAPGYVGYTDSEPRLYILKRKPYSVILIDEVEKSSSNLYNIWLNMLEEGEITLSSGEKVSCRNSIIIFTGNVGTKALELNNSGIGFNTKSKEEKRKTDIDTVMREVKKEFRPEFINRLSKVIVFNSLGKEELDKIFYLELKKLQDRLKENNGYTLEVTDKVKDFIVDKCEPQYGARSLQRLIVEYIEQEVCKQMLEQEDISGKYGIAVDYADDKISVKFD